nr:hypothetical protein [Tanacetum cinerariifolium]
MTKFNKEKKSVNNFKRTARMSVRPSCFNNTRPSSPPYQALSPPTDYQTAPPSSPNISPPVSPIITLGISPSNFFLTLKSSPPQLTSPPPAPTQPSKHSSPLTINLDPVELIFSTPPTSPHALFDPLDYVPPRTINPPPPRPLFESIERLANRTPPLPAIEPPLPPLPPYLPPIRPNNPFPILTHDMFCEHYQRTQVVVDNLCDEIRFILNHYLDRSSYSNFRPRRVKIHNVPMGAFLEVGLSLIASKLGRTILMEAYNSDLCLNLCGRNSYARILIEISLNCKFVESMVVAIPSEDGSSQSLETLEVEFEWKPPSPGLSQGVGSHATRKKGNGKAAQSHHIEGIRLSKSKSNVVFRPVNKDGVNGAGKKDSKLSNGDSGVTKDTSISSSSMDLSRRSTNDNDVFKDCRKGMTVERDKSIDSINAIGKDDDVGSVCERGGGAVKPLESVLYKQKSSLDDEVAKVQEENSIYALFMATKKASNSKSDCLMLDLDDESDEDEVYMLDDDMSKHVSLTDGGAN